MKKEELKKLTKEDQEHLKDVRCRTSAAFEISINKQMKFSRKHYPLFPVCPDCKRIAKKLGIEPVGGWKMVLKKDTKKSTRVKVDTSEYECAHGAKPRGFGSWAFSLPTGQEFSDDIFWTPGAMLYSEAVKLAKKEAAQLGVKVIYTLP